ncbi:MAG: 4'-phosphopantetheinyl transferase superfamily protein [Muribaculaceae bacterium]|nr:4'-phosphopantetheinyl transferase superfamily protein [Muribaculaceae bacterium]
MIRTYIIDVRQFEDEKLFERALGFVSPYRRQKITLLKHWKDKNRSLGAGIALHKALQDYGLEERIMEYDVGAQGKPYFRYYPDIHFSLSHSGHYAICSIGGVEVGNDIEWVRSGKERLAERFFAKEELAWIRRAGTIEEQAERMFRIWTMKESFLKVTGLGMSLPLDAFTISVEEDGSVSVRHNINNNSYFMKEYHMPDSLQENVRYRIAVCCEEADFASDLETIVIE